MSSEIGVCYVARSALLFKRPKKVITGFICKALKYFYLQTALIFFS